MFGVALSINMTLLTELRIYYPITLKGVTIHVILSEAKNLREDDVFLRDSSLRSE